MALHTSAHELIATLQPSDQAKAYDIAKLVIDSIPPGVLQELRREQHISQQNLASEMNVPQSAISKLERSSEAYIGTLYRYLASMNVKLHLIGEYPDGSLRRITQFMKPAVLDEMLTPDPHQKAGAVDLVTSAKSLALVSGRHGISGDDTKMVSDPSQVGFRLSIGASTGVFRNRKRGAEPPIESQVMLTLQDATANFAIFAQDAYVRIAFMVSLIIQALAFKSGALIFDMQNEFISALAGLTKVLQVGSKVGQLGIDLLTGLTPDVAAGVLAKSLEFADEKSAPFLRGLARAHFENALSLLAHVQGEYTVRSLYHYVTDEGFRSGIIVTATSELRDLQSRAANGDYEAARGIRQLRSALDYELNVVPTYSEADRDGMILATKHGLDYFADPEVANAFCDPKRPQARIEDLVDGGVIVVSDEIDEAASRVVKPLIKERFFQVLRASAAFKPGSRKELPVLFVCDDYEKLCSDRDAELFGESRDLNVIGIVGAQSIDSYVKPMGSERAASELLGHFGNAIAFRSDESTMAYLVRKLSDVELPGQLPFVNEGLHKTANNDLRVTDEQKSIGQRLLNDLGPNQAVSRLTVRGAMLDALISAPHLDHAMSGRS